MNIENIENNVAPISVCRLTAASKNLPSLAGKGPSLLFAITIITSGGLQIRRFNALNGLRIEKVAKIRCLRKPAGFQGESLF